MNHVPKLRGSFLDAELTIPHGKFVYYKQGTKQTKIDEHHSKIDTILYIVQTGVYLNGLKEGVWVLYNVNGNKASLKTYEAGKLNGLYEEYSFNGATLSRSMYIDDVREGDSYIFRSDSSIGRYIKFWHGSPIDSKDYSESEQVYSAYPGFNFEYHIYKYLKKMGLTGMQGNVIITFTVDETGKLFNPKVALGLSPELDKAIIESINNSPKWVAARENKKRIKQKITLAFKYTGNDEQ